MIGDKELFRKRAIAVILACSLVAVMGVWSLWPGIGAQAVFDIAEGTFKDYVSHRGWSTADFIPPTPSAAEREGSIVRLDWKSKKQPECSIQVDVDRKTANARPAWQCL
jgi:hypothetical protein